MSAVLTKELKEALDKFKGELSYGLAIKKLLTEELNSYSEGYKKGKKDGYRQGVKDWQIWYYCKVCDKRINIKPNGNSHKALIGYMQEHGWGHAECHEKE